MKSNQKSKQWMYVDYFSGLVYQLQALSKGVRGMGSLFQAPRNLWAENLGERRTRAGDGGDRRSQEAVFPFPATASSSDPARRIFEHSLSRAKGKDDWEGRI